MTGIFSQSCAAHVMKGTILNVSISRQSLNNYVREFKKKKEKAGTIQSWKEKIKTANAPVESVIEEIED